MKRIIALTLFLNYHFLGISQKNEYIDGEVYVRIQEKSFNAKAPNVSFVNELPFIRALNIKTSVAVRPFYKSLSNKLERTYRIKLTETDSVSIQKTIEQLKSIPEIELVERVRLRKIIATSNDPEIANQWYLNKINTFDAWAISTTTSTIKIAVVDNAIQTNHPDLSGNIIGGFDVSDNDSDPNPPNTTFGHGTHVAGLISAVTNNSIGIAAAAKNSVKILAIKATPNTGSANSIYHGYEGIEWAINNGAKIISLSWGGLGFSQVEQDVINNAYNNGILVIAAAGNDNNDTPSYPAAYEHVIAVASTDSDDKRSSFSNFGSWIDISAPGRGILSTLPFNTYASYNGTSMATPLVASVCGYIEAINTTLTPDAIQQLIQKTADDISTQNPTQLGKLGGGRINMLKAVACLQENLTEASLSSSLGNYFCSEEMSTLSTMASPGINYIWKKDGQPLPYSTSSISTNEPGTYSVQLTKQSCTISTNKLTLNQNNNITITPTVKNLEAYYCQPIVPSQGFIASSPSCSLGGPKTFSYSGPPVGFDDSQASGPDPSVVVNELGGTISGITVSITWQKKDANTYYSCGDPDGGSVPFNEEVSFKIISPSGKEITLLSTGTYARGSQTSGMVTTIFRETGTSIPTGSLPASGTFKPQESFASLNGDPAIGIWTLIARDDSFIDPLCVFGFSVTIETNAINGEAEYKWYDSPVGGQLLHVGKEYLPSTSILGVSTYYVSAQCSGGCTSPRQKAIVWVRNVPNIVAFALDPYPLTSFVQNSIEVIEVNNQWILKATNLDGSPFQQLITNTTPLISPITICQTGTYAIAASGCTGTIRWNNGYEGFSQVRTISKETYFSATCLQTWNCPQIESNYFQFSTQNNPISLSNPLPPNHIQNFYGSKIQSIQSLEPINRIKYKAEKEITLEPGFHVKNGSTFTAEIGNCTN